MMVRQKVFMSAAVLTGGKSKRLGCDKAFLKLQNTTLIERALSVIKPIFKETFIVSKDTERFSGLGVRVVKDAFTFQSPLVGIYTGLKMCKFPYCFIFACDMPFLDRGLILYMADKIKGSDCVIIEDAKGMHPLHAIYSKKCMKVIEKNIRDKNFKLAELVRSLKTNKIDLQSILIHGISQQDMPLFNINTQFNLTSARRLA